MSKYDKMTNEDFDRILIEIVNEYGVANLLRIPGVWEIAAEHFNNEVLEQWETEQELDEDQPAGPVLRPIMGGDIMTICRNRNCENFKASADKHQYCPKCCSMANCVMANTRDMKTGNRPTFEQALRVGEHAIRLLSSPYSAPEQIEWAAMVYPDAWAGLFEPRRNDKSTDI